MAVETVQAAPNVQAVADDRKRLLTRRRLWVLVWLVVLLIVADRGVMALLRKAPASSPVGRAMNDRQYLLDHPEARQLLVLGDSRVKWSLDPKILAPGLGLPGGSGLNIAEPGSGYGDDVAIAHWLVNSGLVRDVKVVFWGLAFDRFKNPPNCEFNTYLLFEPGLRGGVGGFADRVLTRCLPSVYQGAAISFSLDTAKARHTTWAQWTGRRVDENYLHRGLMVNTEPPDPDYRPLADAPRYSVKATDARLIIEAARQLHDQGVRVVFVDVPVTPALLAWQKESPEHWKTYGDLIVALREAGAQVHDGQTLNYTPDCFTDAAHLTADAAVRYNHELVRDLGGYATVPSSEPVPGTR